MIKTNPTVVNKSAADSYIHCIGDEPFQLKYSIIDDMWELNQYEKSIDEGMIFTYVLVMSMIYRKQ